MISNAKVRKFVEARYPAYRRDNKVGGWAQPGAGRFISDEDARREAEAEIDAVLDGGALMPKWAQ
jgi:hypothetical protein